jgi:hypothetical protein
MMLMMMRREKSIIFSTLHWVVVVVVLGCRVRKTEEKSVYKNGKCRRWNGKIIFFSLSRLFHKQQ